MKFLRNIVEFAGAYYFGGRDLMSENFHYREALALERMRTQSMDQQIQQMHQNIAEMHDSVGMLMEALIIDEDEEEESSDVEVEKKSDEKKDSN